MGIHEDFIACFRDYDPVVFRSFHHEDFMTVRETELSTLDEHCAIIDKLAAKPDWDWHDKAELVHENFFVAEWRWRDGDEIVTNVSLKKEGKLCRTVISRVPISDTPNPKIYDKSAYE